ncbi:MAG: hypothetical protein WBA93_09725 [Microcoleaceae cyanobacterium]
MVEKIKPGDRYLLDQEIIQESDSSTFRWKFICNKRMRGSGFNISVKC